RSSRHGVGRRSRNAESGGLAPARRGTDRSRSVVARLQRSRVGGSPGGADSLTGTREVPGDLHFESRRVLHEASSTLRSKPTPEAANLLSQIHDRPTHSLQLQAEFPVFPPPMTENRP